MNTLKVFYYIPRTKVAQMGIHDCRTLVDDMGTERVWNW